MSLPPNPKTGAKTIWKIRSISNGESLTLTGVTKGKWDVRVIDEDGDECIITDVTINSDDKWVIRDKDLLAYQNQ